MTVVSMPTILVYQIPIVSYIKSNLNDDLDTLGKWLSANKLSANLVKTEYKLRQKKLRQQN